MKTIISYFKPALLLVALVGFFVAPVDAFAEGDTTTASGNNAKRLLTNNTLDNQSGTNVITQVYNIIKFAYVFFYAIAVMLVAQAWLQFKQQKYDVMFASMGAALGLFLTPAIIDFLHGLGKNTAAGGTTT